MRIALPVLLLLLLIASCKKETVPDESAAPPALNINYSASPIALNGIDAKFAANVSYNHHSRSVFDIFLPASGTPTAVVIYLHGGGFIAGDKSAVYGSDGAETIRYFLQNKVAFVTANYQFMQDDTAQGLYTSLNDIKRCLQFIRYYAVSFNINKTKVAAYGGSAGGGASIWLAFHPDMADAAAAEPLKRESTRLTAAGHSTSQASYDPVTVNSMFAAAGINNYYALPGVSEQAMGAYHIQNPNQLSTDQRVVAMRKDVDMLGLMTADDPEFYTQNDNPDIRPASVQEANHVPLHAKTLAAKAQSIGLASKANIPAFGIDNTGGETLPAFLVRKLR